MTPRILAVDAGTTSVKVCLFSEDLVLIKKSVREYALKTSPGRAEAGADIYLQAIRRGIREAAEDGLSVSAIALTTQGETMTVTDGYGNPLLPFIVWLDQRAGAEAEALKHDFPDDLFYRRTGLPSLTGAVPMAKALWLKNNFPSLLTGGSRILLLEDYLLHFMTGRFVTEKTLQTSTGWFALGSDGLWEDALSAAGLTSDMLPEILESGEYAGPLLPGAAAFLGLPSGIPVFTGAMDQVSASCAVHSLFPGAAAETTGTALTVGAVLHGTHVPPGKELPRATVYRHVRRGDYLLLPIGNTGGMSLTWFRDRLCPGLDYAALCRMAQTVPPGAGGLLFLPFLDGSVDPELCPEARAVFFGASLSTDRACFVRAVLEGVAHLLSDLLDVTEKWGVAPGPVCSLGGGSASPLWEQIKADICGREFFTLECGEAPALGAALLAGRGAGILPEGSLPVVGITGRYAPKEENRALYAAAHEKYRRLFEVLRPLY